MSTSTRPDAASAAAPPRRRTRRVPVRLLRDGRILVILQPDVMRALGLHLGGQPVVARASTCEWDPALGSWVLDFRPVGGPVVAEPGRWKAHERDAAIRFELDWLAEHWHEIAPQAGPAEPPGGTTDEHRDRDPGNAPGPGG